MSDGSENNTTSEKTKNFSWSTLISALCCLAPVIFGIAKWNDLPSRMPTHWGFNGNVNGYMTKPFAVFGLPVLCAAITIMTGYLVKMQDKGKGKKSDRRIIAASKWLIPVLTVACSVMTYTAALNFPVNVIMVIGFLTAFIFILLGSLICKNNTISGAVMILQGLVNAVCSFFSFENYVLMATIIVTVVLQLIFFIVTKITAGRNKAPEQTEAN